MRRGSVVSVSNVAAAADDVVTSNHVPLKTSPNASGSRSSIRSNEDHKTKAEDSINPSPLNHSNKNSLSSHNRSRQTSETDECKEDFELQDMCHSEKSLEIAILSNPMDENNQSFSRKKIWNPANGRSVDDVNIQIDDGCTNPSFTKSEITVAIPIDDNPKINRNSKSFSRQNSAASKKSDSDPNVKNVL